MDEFIATGNAVVALSAQTAATLARNEPEVRDALNEVKSAAAGLLEARERLQAAVAALDEAIASGTNIGSNLSRSPDAPRGFH